MLPNNFKGLRIEEKRRERETRSSGQVERFEGSLVTGKTYTAELVFDEKGGWQLAERIKMLPHHAARIEWIDKKRILSALIKENRYQIEFTVLEKSVGQAGNTRRWNTTYKCEVREAFILIPPKAQGF
jgi:hypothetical protein